MNPFIAQALNVKQNFEQEREDAKFALNLEQLRSNKSDEEAHKRQQALGVFGQLMNTAQESMKDLLPQDKERVNAKYQELIQPILTNLKTNGVDPDRYLMTGGAAELPATFGALANSDELRNGISNAQKRAHMLLDFGSGKIYNDPNQAQKVQDFMDNKTPVFEYNGAFSAPKLDDLEFSKIERPVGAPDNVSMAQVIQHAAAKDGLNAQQTKALEQSGAYDKYKDPTDPTGQRSILKWKSPKVVPYGSTKAGFEERYGAGGVNNLPNADMLSGFNLSKGVGEKRTINVDGKNVTATFSPFLKGYTSPNKYKNGSKYVTGSYLMPDGTVEVAYDEKGKDGGNTETFKTQWDAYNAIMHRHYPQTAADKIVNQSLKFANQNGFASQIGAPILNSAGEEAKSEYYSNISETEDGMTIGVKDGKWYNTATGEEIK